MAPIELQSAGGMKTKRKLHPQVSIDMTPMVDLGFLLITFFIFTTRMMEPTTMGLNMPKLDTLHPIELKESNALTVLLDENDKVYAYEGSWNNAVKNDAIIPSGYTESDGIGKLIRMKKMKLEQMNKEEGSKGLMLLIKPDTRSSYQNIIDALDETAINAVAIYAVVDLSLEEKAYLERQRKSNKGL